MNRLTLRRVGRHYVGAGFSADKMRPHVERLSAAANLSDLTSQYCFYTPAMIYCCVRLLGRDFYTDFMQETGRDVLPISVRFSKPLFSGFELGRDLDWNYVLYGMELPDWLAFKAWLGTAAFQDRDRRLLSRVRTQDITIADPLYFEKAVILPEVCPTVPVTVFALDTSRGCWYIDASGHPLLDLPKLRFTSEVYADTKAFADALFDDADNPYKSVDTAKYGQQMSEMQEIEARYRQTKEKQS